MKCPHCGADVTGDTCEFCGQKVIVKDQGSTANHTAAGGYAGYDPNNPAPGRHQARRRRNGMRRPGSSYSS